MIKINIYASKKLIDKKNRAIFIHKFIKKRIIKNKQDNCEQENFFISSKSDDNEIDDFLWTVGERSIFLPHAKDNNKKHLIKYSPIIISTLNLAENNLSKNNLINLKNFSFCIFSDLIYSDHNFKELLFNKAKLNFNKNRKTFLNNLKFFSNIIIMIANINDFDKIISLFSTNSFIINPWQEVNNSWIKFS